MEYKEFTAKNVDDAITDATIEFGVTSDKLDYEVVTEGSAGLFGIFAKQAVIRARVREEAKQTAEAEPEIKPVKAAVKEKPQTKKKEAEKAAPAEKKEPKNAAPAKAEAKKSQSRNTDSGQLKETLEKFLTDVLDKMEMPAQINVKIDDRERTIDIDLEGETGDIIGKRGQTLDALQYLASIVANKEKEEYYRLKLDTKNYRERRAKTLENLAKNCASKVKKTKKKIVLEPMNPYERRIIHAYLQSDKQVATKSEGEEPNRRVVVYYKR